MSIKTLAGISAAAILSILAGNAYAAQIYSNELSGDAEIMPASYGSVKVSGGVIAGTLYASQTSLSVESGNNYAAIIKKVSGNGDIQSHTISGWFKVSALPTGDALQTLWLAKSFEGGHGGYKVAVDASGKIHLGKIDWASGVGNWNGSHVVTSSAAIDAGWHYITVAVTKAADGRTATATVNVDGTDAPTEGTFATNINGNGCSDLYIGANVSVAGMYVDDTAFDAQAVTDNLAKAVSTDYVAIGPKTAWGSSTNTDYIPIATSAENAKPLFYGVTLSDLSSKYAFKATLKGSWITSAKTATVVKCAASSESALLLQVQTYDDGNMKMQNLTLVEKTVSDTPCICAYGARGIYKSGNSIGTEVTSGTTATTADDAYATVMLEAYPVGNVASIDGVEYPTLQAAVTAAGAANTEIQILAPCSGETVEIPSNVTIKTVDGVTFDVTVSGAGTLVYEGGVPMGATATSLTQAAWTGTVHLKNIANLNDAQGGSSGFNFMAYGNSGSKIACENIAGWLGNTAVTSEIVTVGSGLIVRDGSSGSQWSYVFNKVSGSGAFKFDYSNNGTDDNMTGFQPIHIKDVSGFTGSFWTDAGGLWITDSTETGSTGAAWSKRVIIDSGKSVTMSAEWTAPSGVEINGALTIAETVTPSGVTFKLMNTDATLTVATELAEGSVASGVTGMHAEYSDGAYKLVVDKTPTELFLEGIAAGGDVTLTGAVTLDAAAVIPADKTVTLDLNGCTVTAPGTVISVLGTLTVKDTGTDGKIVSTGNCGIAVGNGATLTVNSGIIESVEGAIITGKSVGAKITINDGMFSASDNAVIAGNGSAREGDGNTITIHGGTFNGTIKSTGYIACGIYAPWKDQITVDGGTFNITGGCGVCARAGTVAIGSGVTINLINEGTVSGWVGDNKNAVPGVQAFFDYAAKYPGLAEGDAIFSDVNTLTIADTQEWVGDTAPYTLADKPTGPQSWEETTPSEVIELPEGATTTVTATEIAAWAAKNKVAFDAGTTIPVNALIFNVAPDAVPADPEAAADTILEELASKVDITAMTAGTLDAATLELLEKEYPMATIKLVESTKIQSTDTAKFFQLSIELK